MQLEVLGMKEFRRELKRAQNLEPKAINQVNNDVASFVKDRAERRAGSTSAVNLAGNRISRMFARAGRSLTARRAASKAAVGLGGARHPEALGAEFGAVAARKSQFAPWRGNQYVDALDGAGVGYFLHPTIRDERDRIIDLYGDAIETLAARAFPD